MKEARRDPYVAADPRAPIVTAELREWVKTASAYQQRRERGRAARQRTPRSSHAAWTPAPDRPDPVELLEAQAENRQPDLVPLRYARMTPSPFAFMRGAAIVMAHDLAGTPHTGIQAQLCGDCHLLNFGAYASRSGPCCSTSTTSTRPCRGPGSGT